ncbi:MAG: (2Fe-2S) ferredoxin domain-containing protein [Myxococcaceae bacterium]
MMPPYQHHVFVCTNRREPGHAKGDCASKGGESIRERFREVLSEMGLRAKVRANAAGCLDACALGCTVVVYPEGVWYGGVQAADVDEIVRSHLLGGSPVERLRLFTKKT